MRKKLIGTLLMGALLGSSTSVFVSCKDYDDDINKNASDISALQTQLTTLETALAEAKAEAAAAKEAADAASSSLDEKIIELLAQMEGADEETKAAIQQQIEDLKSNYATKAELAAANAKVTALETAIEDLKTTSLTEEDVKRIVSEVAGVDPGLLIPALQPYFDAIDVKIAACQNQIENQRNVLNALIEALLGDDVATARIRAALTAIDENGNIDDATLEALKKRMQNISDVVDEIAPEGNVISLFVDKLLKSLVFIPQTYYWGVEAAKIVRLTPYPYVLEGTAGASSVKWPMKRLKNYINKDDECEELIGSNEIGKAPTTGIEPTTDYDLTNQDRETTHDRYSYAATPITVMLEATASYHINPSNAKFDDDMKVSVLSAAKDYTRAKSAATVSLLGAADKANGLWTVERGILNVPLNVVGTLGTVENDAITGAPDNSKSGLTTFAVQVQYGDTTVTSDYAALIEETVKDLRLSHKPYKASGRTTDKDFIETGVLNTHCGQCALTEYLLAGQQKGLHLFATVGEARHFVENNANHDGQDYVGFQEDKNLTALVEIHYTNANGQHAKFKDEEFTRNFEYKFELTDFRVGDGSKTNESAHAAIYEKDGIYYLHPQDPEAGGLNGRDYQGADDKATEVVVGRVPLVRVSLLYRPDKTKEGEVVDYGYLPISITKEAEVERQKDFIYTSYVSDKDVTLNRYNECYYEGGTDINAYKSDWRETEETLMSHEAFTKPVSEGGLGRALTREEFEKHYTAVSSTGNPLDLDQFYLPNEAAYLAGTAAPAQPQPVNGTPKNGKMGKIAYIEGGFGTSGLATSILSWDLTAAEVEQVANTTGWDKVVRAIKLESDDIVTYPDLYVIFTSGVFGIESKIVEADMKITTHRINQYWYTSGTFATGSDEIHTNVITPEENQYRATNMDDGNFHLWKPTDFENLLQYVFEKNFASEGFPRWMDITGQSTTAGQPFNADNITLGIFFDDSNNGAIMKGYISADAPKEFRLSNTYGLDTSKKNLYATQVGTTTTQLVATIDGNWQGTYTTQNLTALRATSVKLANTAYAKALLNYVDHELIGEPNVLNAAVAVLPLTNGTDAPEVKTENGKSYINGAVKYAHDGTVDYCKLYIKDYKFDVRFLRPVSISNLDDTVIEDATSDTNEPQVIYLNELVKNYTDFRGNETEPNWKNYWDADPTKTDPTKKGLDYEEYYAPDGTNKFAVSVQGVRVGQLLSANVNVKTDLNKENRDAAHEWVSLADVSSQVIFEMKAADAIEYRNAGSTVQEFRIKIPVQVEYYWGTIYDEVIVTIKKTKANARQK